MARIRSPKKFWTAMGSGAAIRGLKVGAMITGTPYVDAWIEAGYNEVVRKRERKALAEHKLIMGKVGHVL